MKKKELKHIIPFVIILLTFTILFLSNTKKNNEQFKPEAKTMLNLQSADMLYYNEEYVDAIQLYKSIIKSTPQNYGAYIGLGKSYTKLKLYGEAIKTFEETFKLNYHDFRTYSGLGFAYYLNEDYNKAYYNFKVAYKLNTIDRGVIYYLIHVYSALGMYDNAISLTNSQLQKEPQSAHLYRRLAFAYLLKGNDSEALVNAEKSIQLNTTLVENSWTLATIHLYQGDIQKALDEFNKISSIYKNNYVYESLSIIYSLNGNTEKSKENSQLAASYPVHSLSLSTLGFALLENGAYERAIEEFNAASKVKPDYYLPYKGLGEAYLLLGDKVKAKEYLGRALELNEFDKEIPELLDQTG